jgi:hypothetical protein
VVEFGFGFGIGLFQSGEKGFHFGFGKGGFGGHGGSARFLPAD